MNIPKTLKETVSSAPEVIDENTIELVITEKWEITKSNLLSAKQNIETHVNEKQAIVDKINQYLVMLGEEIGDDIMVFTSKCSVYRNTDQSAPAEAYTKIQLNVKDYDIDDEFDSTINYRFQPKIAGYYHISAACFLEDIVGGYYINTGIYKNGVLWKDGKQSVVGGNDGGISVISCDMYLLSTDYIELFVYNSHPSAYPIDGTIRRTFMDIHRFA